MRLQSHSDRKCWYIFFHHALFVTGFYHTAGNNGRIKIRQNSLQNAFDAMTACDNLSGAYFPSYVRGHHVCEEVWMPFVGEALTY